jgi:GNAT superfamily N-acetyltransferase
MTLTLLSRPLRAVANAALSVEIHPVVAGDAEAVGRITYEAFRSFHESHGFTPDFPNVEAAIGLAAAQIADPKTFGVVAFSGGKIVGSNFLTEGDPIRGVGPITVHPSLQGAGIGRRLMQAVIDRGRDALGIRLVQDAFNSKTMALYTSLGFDPREPLAVLIGSPRNAPADARVRPMTHDDLDQAAALATRVHGFARSADLRAALAQDEPMVLERDGRITAYMTMPHLWLLNHAVAETEADLKTLILGTGAARARPLGFLMPIRQASLFRWCLTQGMQVVKPMTLMSRGHYAEPAGAYLPSVFY